jgi:hypothetical protein
MNKSEYQLLQKPNLIVLCKSRGLPANSQLRKDELIERLMKDDAKKTASVKKPIIILNEEEINFDEEPIPAPPVKQTPAPVVKETPAPPAPVVKQTPAPVVKETPAPPAVRSFASVVRHTPKPPASDVKSESSEDSFYKSNKPTQIDFIMRFPVPRGTSSEWHLMRMLHSIHPERFQLTGVGHTSNDDDSQHITLRVDTTRENTPKPAKPWSFYNDYHIYYSYSPENKVIYTMVTSLEGMSGQPRILCYFTKDSFT